MVQPVKRKVLKYQLTQKCWDLNFINYKFYLIYYLRKTKYLHEN